MTDTTTETREDLAAAAAVHLTAGWEALNRATDRYQAGDGRADRSHRLAIDEKARAFQLVSRLWLLDSHDTRMLELVSELQELKDALTDLAGAR